MIFEPGESHSVPTTIFIQDKIKTLVLVLLVDQHHLPVGLHQQATRPDGSRFIYNGYKGVLKCWLQNTTSGRIYLQRGTLMGKLSLIPYCRNTLPPPSPVPMTEEQ